MNNENTAVSNTVEAICENLKTDTVMVKLAATLDAALEMNKEITGENFYECYENEKARTERIIEEGRVESYMVTNTGVIYYMFKGQYGERILNKLSLHSGLTDGGCGTACVIQNEENGLGVIFPPQKYNLSRCASNRKQWAKTSTIAMTTEQF